MRGTLSGPEGFLPGEFVQASSLYTPPPRRPDLFPARPHETRPAPVHENELIARVLAEDTRAARELYDGHAPRVYRLIYRLCGDDELAQDLTQDVFIRAFDRLDRFRGESTLSTWLHRIAITVTANG